MATFVAVVEIDDKKLDAASKPFPPTPRQYVDFRKMLDEAARISTPSRSALGHTHAVAAAMAMRMGKHASVKSRPSRTRCTKPEAGRNRRRMKVARRWANGDRRQRTCKGAAIGPRGFARQRQGSSTSGPSYVCTRWRSYRRKRPVLQPALGEWLGPARIVPYAGGYHPSLARAGGTAAPAIWRHGLPYGHLSSRPRPARSDSIEARKRRGTTKTAIPSGR